ncbi:hypothetical protein [Paenibacillus illinoisensis]|uniref:hypothetical protein n=1 Tax=Paenibacillus illinoisensis TaxID=59845 RepID=UPI001C8EEE39|nr:hypothetical protein [Paenibacillus illinoisensis]
MDDYDQRLKDLQATLETLIDNYDLLPDASYQIFSIEGEIRSFEQRKERLNLKFSRIDCHLCKQPIWNEDEPAKLGDRGSILICPRCLCTIKQVKGTTEMEHDLEINSPGTVKQDCEGPLKILQSEFLIRKSEKFWLIHEVVGEIYYRAGRRKTNLLHSWIDEMINRLNHLQEQKRFMEGMRTLIPDLHTQIFSLQAQIQDLQSKVDRIKGGRIPYRCSQCNQWLKDSGIPTFFGNYTICDQCKKIISEVMTTSEAEKKHGLPKGTIRRDNSRGTLEKYKKLGLLRQSGSLWLLHDIVILDKYKRIETKEQELPAHSHATMSRESIPSDLLKRSASIYKQVMERKQLEKNDI